MSQRPSNLIVATIKRNQRFRGPTFSEQHNDFQQEVVRDLTSIQQEWNTKIVPLMSLLPDGSVDTGLNAFSNGLDGRTLLVNASATALLSSGKYYNSTQGRPNSLFEQMVNVYTYIDEQIDGIAASLESEGSGGGLTAEQKSRIGDNIFDTDTASSGSSLDGKVTTHSGNILQIARDLYGTSSPTLNSNGTTVLNNSIRAQLDALLELHGGNWDDDIAVNHSVISASDITTGTMAQHLVGPSSSSPGGVDDTYSGVPTNSREDLNLIRQLLKTFKGTAAFSTAIAPDGTWSAVTPSPTSYANLISLKGSASRTTVNPWGLSYADISDLVTALTALVTFTGQDSINDTSPTYSNINNFSQGDPLTTAIGGLAEALTNLDNEVFSQSGFLQSEIDSKVDGSGTSSGIAFFQDDGSITTDPLLNWDNINNQLGINILQQDVNSTLTIDGSVSAMPLLTSSNVILDETHFSVYVDASSNNRLVTLPTAADVEGRIYVIKKVDNTGNTVTISGIDTIDGAGSLVLSTTMEGATLQATSLGYFVLAIV